MNRLGEDILVGQQHHRAIRQDTRIGIDKLLLLIMEEKEIIILSVLFRLL